jgi:hypothetical protein
MLTTVSEMVGGQLRQVSLYNVTSCWLYLEKCVFHLWYQVFYGIMHVIYFIMMEYTISYREICYLVNRSWQTLCRGADKSLARPGRTQATATEYFDVHISYL